MFIAGFEVAALRQKSAVAFSGEIPKDSAGILYEPFVIDQLLTYVDSDDHTKSALAAGGLYDLGNEQALKVLEIRALTALGNISAIVGDRADAQSMKLTVGGGTPAINLTTLGVVAGDIVTVISGGGPLTETYTVVKVLSTTEMQVDGLVATRSLAAPDVFSIVGRDGTVRYTHTMAATNTLDIDPLTTHDTPVGTPAASILQFVPPLIVLPTQVLKVSTAGSHADGWLDIYVVKAVFR